MCRLRPWAPAHPDVPLPVLAAFLVYLRGLPGRGAYLAPSCPGHRKTKAAHRYPRRLSFSHSRSLLSTSNMEDCALLQELKKRAKGDENKQRRIKTLLKNKEFIEFYQIARAAKPDLYALLSDSAEEAWKEVNKRYMELGASDCEEACFESISVGRAWKEMAVLKRVTEKLKKALDEKKEKEKEQLGAHRKKVQELEEENRRLRLAALNFPVEKMEAVMEVQAVRKKVEDRWEKLVQEMGRNHQHAERELISMMQRQSEKITELRASGGGAVSSTKGRDKKRHRHDFGYRPKKKKSKGGKAEQMPPPAKM